MVQPTRTVLTGARVVLPGGVVDSGRVTVEDTRIAGAGTDAERAPQGGAVPDRSGDATRDQSGDATRDQSGAEVLDQSGDATRDQSGAEVLDLSGCWVVPGFIDMHVHGGGGGSFSAGSPEEALTAARTHREHGTTTMLASTVTGDLDDLARQAAVLSELVEQGELAGVHFEGPFISPHRCGAHQPSLLRAPDPADVRKLLDAARGTARMMTLAPELPGGLESVRLLADHGVLAAVGHTDSGYEAALEAVEAGATVATHLFNAMPALLHREPGPVAALLEDERVTIELINDGTHLHPAVLQLAFHRAGADRVAFITDAMGAAGMSDGRYPLGPMEVEVKGGVARISDGPTAGSIAGSTLTLDLAFRRAVTVDGLSVEQTVRALSGTPARVLGIADRVGSLEPGKDADLVVLGEDFRIRGVMRRGHWVVRPELG
ncbi:N-acetylglucosamine-6-phosphate deacetylase [Streptomyces sp. NPDC005271]|uniref:N-acetylglucosamine-6-phosphate deacetylase n=1 Tax=unclassified Streptomyces TaxID=2593676 RepID=UPI0033B1939D